MEYYILQFVLLMIIFARIVTLFSVAPIYSNTVIPIQVRISIALFFSFVLFSLLKDTAPKINLDILSFSLLVVIETIVGLTIGFMMTLIFWGMQYAGELMGFDLGLNIATLYDPETGNNPVLGRFFNYVALLIFLLINGHHFVINAIKISYDSIPIGGFTLSADFIEKVSKLTSIIFILSIKIAAPILVSLFLTNISLGIMSRVVPQMNIFLVGAPLKIGVGIVIISIIMPFIITVFRKLLYTFESNVIEIIRVM